MIKFIGKRIAMIIPVAFLVSVFSFALIHFAPGDPALFYIVPGMTEEQERRYVQVWDWMIQLLYNMEIGL